MIQLQQIDQHCSKNSTLLCTFLFKAFLSKLSSHLIQKVLDLHLCIVTLHLSPDPLPKTHDHHSNVLAHWGVVENDPEVGMQGFEASVVQRVWLHWNLIEKGVADRILKIRHIYDIR